MSGALAVTLVGLLLVTAQSVNGQCTDSKIRQCLQTLQTLSLTSYTQATLNEACPKFTQVGTCMTNNGCYDSDQRVKLSWVGLRDGFAYICGPGRQTIIASSTCLSGSGVTQGINRCSQTAQQGASSATTNTAKCRLANTLLTCIKNAVTSQCGSDAGRVMAIVTAKIVQPAISHTVPGCTLNAPSYQARAYREIDEPIASEAFEEVLESIDRLFK